MANNYFTFKHFTVYQDKCAFKVGTDGVLLGAAADISGASQILDIGTGTGLIALMLAQRSDARIVALEPDSESFSQAVSNVERSNWASRIQLINSSLQNFYPENQEFDLVVSNPPFFSDSLKNPDEIKASARHNDLLNNDDLLKGVIRLLSPAGRFQVIMPYAEGNIFIVDANNYGLYCNSILKIKPLPKSDIRRLILTFSRTKQKTSEQFLTIEYGKRHEFTREYINLTKDFYLKF